MTPSQDQAPRQDHRIQLIVAVIGMVGVVATGLFANWTSIFGPPAAPEPFAPHELGTRERPSPGPPAPNLSVEPTIPDRSDLTFTGWTLSPKTPVQGEPVHVTVGIENLGPQDAANFEVHWWAGVGEAEPARTWTVELLEVGQRRTLTFTYPGYSSWYARRDTRVDLDPGERVVDPDRSDNTWTRAIAVSRP